jgi:hypothetical protein
VWRTNNDPHFFPTPSISIIRRERWTLIVLLFLLLFVVACLAIRNKFFIYFIASMSFYHFVIKTVPRDRSPVKKVKLSLTNSMLLCGALLLVGSKCTAGRPKRSDDDDNKASDDDKASPGEDFVSRIMAVGCNGYCFMESLDFPLEELDSYMTPMTGKTAKEIDVKLGPLQTPALSLSRPRQNAFDILLAAPVPTILPVFSIDEVESVPPSGTIQEQLHAVLFLYFLRKFGSVFIIPQPNCSFRQIFTRSLTSFVSSMDIGKLYSED